MYKLRQGITTFTCILKRFKLDCSILITTNLTWKLLLGWNLMKKGYKRCIYSITKF